jgi:hypothetical protein
MRGAARGAIQKGARLEANRDAAFAAQLDQLLKARTGCTLGNQHTVQRMAGPKCLPDGMDSCEREH